MLPGIRAVFGAIVAAAALLTVSFWLAATFRAAQDGRTGLLQADLAQRARLPLPAANEPLPIVIDKPAPLEANPVQPVEVAQAPELVAEPPQLPPPIVVAAAPITLPADEPPLPEPAAAERAPAELKASEPPAIEASVTPPAVTEPTIESLIAELASGPPMGGPLAEPRATRTQQQARKSAHARAVKIAKKKAAAEKRAERAAAAKKARAERLARLARERKIAARRAARARAKQQAAAPVNNGSFGNSFGNSSFGSNSFGNGAFGNNSFGTGTFGTSTTRR